MAIDLNLWIEAADLRHTMRKTQKDFGIIDALLLAVQRMLDCTLVTGDPHFKGLKRIRML